ncbi:MAG TPA: glycosyltransferase family 39 protein [Candidatus Binataceae bacterium]|nr:glycosyltransferase family 39 protein [Candidatus Binataceae bacterium]
MELAAEGTSPTAAAPDGAAESRRITGWLARCSERQVVCAVTALAALIRLYLVATSYCIAADGVAYLAMAREFAAGRARDALAWVFSPLYPWLVAQVHWAISNWELAGELLSVALGSAGVALLYYLMREAFGRRAVAAVAATLAAIHPMLAAFSASARTEAGYVALVTAALALTMRAGRRQSLELAAAAGALCGLAYLYRTEGVGVPAAAAVMLVAGALVWRQWALRWGIGAAAILVAVFVLVASPYLLWLRQYTGHWTVGREVGVVTMEATGSTKGELERWRHLGYRRENSWLSAVRMDPGAYLRKVGRDFVGSCYAFVQATDPLLFAALLVGLWAGGRALLVRWEEATLALIVAMYFIGFVLTDTGPRLMSHVVPFVFGWIAIGLEVAAGRLDAHLRRARRPILRRVGGDVIVATVVALVLLPRTLFPLGYDQRGLRYAGQELARRGAGAVTVAGTDVRVAFYAEARFIRLPAYPAGPGGLCGWLAEHRAANYLMIDDRTERRWGGGGGSPCLSLIKRYPRVGSTWYDLYALREPSSS